MSVSLESSRSLSYRKEDKFPDSWMECIRLCLATSLCHPNVTTRLPVGLIRPRPLVQNSSLILSMSNRKTFPPRSLPLFWRHVPCCEEVPVWARPCRNAHCWMQDDNKVAIVVTPPDFWPSSIFSSFVPSFAKNQPQMCETRRLKTFHVSRYFTVSGDESRKENVTKLSLLQPVNELVEFHEKSAASLTILRMCEKRGIGKSHVYAIKRHRFSIGRSNF